jgi:hypothetical protein
MTNRFYGLPWNHNRSALVTAKPSSPNRRDRARVKREIWEKLTVHLETIALLSSRR